MLQAVVTIDIYLDGPQKLFHGLIWKMYFNFLEKWGITLVIQWNIQKPSNLRVKKMVLNAIAEIWKEVWCGKYKK